MEYVRHAIESLIRPCSDALAFNGLLDHMRRYNAAYMTVRSADEPLGLKNTHCVSSEKLGGSSL